MAQTKQYQVAEARNPEMLRTELNRLAEQGFEIMNILPYGPTFIIVGVRTVG